MRSNGKILSAVSIILSYFIFSTVVNSILQVGPCSKSCKQANVTNEASGVPTCMCDDQCHRYGDCCYDAANSELNLNKTSTYPQCSYVSQSGSFYVNRTCRSAAFRKRCQKSVNYTAQTNRPRTKIPVTSLSTGITYGNVFCAKCQNVTDYRPWNAMFTCQTYSRIITNLSLSGSGGPINGAGLKSKFVNATNSWSVTNTAANTTEKCTLSAVLPDSFKTIARRCYTNTIKKCASNATRQQTYQCQSYQSFVFNGTGVPYKNSFCALCNGDNAYKCSVNATGGSRTTATTATTASSSRATTRTTVPPSRAPTRTTASPSRATTVTTSPPSTTTATQTTPVPVRVSSKLKTYVHFSFNMGVVDVLTSINLTKVQTETVHYHTFNRTYVRNTTFIASQRGSAMRICRLKNDTTVTGVPMRSYLFKSIQVSAAVAILAMALHLRAYLSPEYVKTCTHKITASCALTFLMANTGALLDEYNGVAGYVWYYGFISSFLWTSSMAFDATLAAWSVAGDYSTAAKKWNVDESARLTVYSWLSWLSPVAMTIMILIWHADLANWDFAIMDSYDEDITFVLLFVLPLAVAMSVDLGFFICSMYVIRTEPETADKLSKLGIEYGLLGGIGLVSNLMWTCMAVADYSGNLWGYLGYAVFDVVLAVLMYRASPPRVHHFPTK